MNEMFTLEIPKDVENLQLPNPTLLDYYKDTEQRTFWLEGEVNDETLELVKTIMRINHEDEKYKMSIEERVPIKIFIDTHGGDAQVMWTLMNAIAISKTPVYTIVYCTAMSAGSYILSAGHKRFAFPVRPFWFILAESDIRVRSNRLNPQRSIGTGSIREQTVSSWHTPLSRQRI